MDCGLSHQGGPARQIRQAAFQKGNSGWRMGPKPTGEGNWSSQAAKKNLGSRVFSAAVPQTDTGRLAEYAKALGIILVKELGKMAP